MVTFSYHFKFSQRRKTITAQLEAHLVPFPGPSLPSLEAAAPMNSGVALQVVFIPCVKQNMVAFLNLLNDVSIT